MAKTTLITPLSIRGKTSGALDLDGRYLLVGFCLSLLFACAIVSEPIFTDFHLVKGTLQSLADLNNSGTGHPVLEVWPFFRTYGLLLAAHLVALFLPYAAISIVLTSLLPNLNSNVRRTSSFALYALFLFTCLRILNYEREFSTLGLRTLQTLPTEYSALVVLRSITITVIIVGFFSSIILRAPTKWVRTLRLIAVLLCFSGLVYWDWRVSFENDDLGEQASLATSFHRIVMVVPKVQEQEIKSSLQYSKQPVVLPHLEHIGKVVPVSSTTLGQFTSLATGTLPYEHNVRHDYQSALSLRRTAEFISSYFYQPTGVRYAGTVGPRDAVDTLLEGIGSDGTYCGAQEKLEILEKTLPKRSIMLALLPKFILTKLFPQLICSSQFLSHEEQLNIQLDGMGATFRTKPNGEAWLYISGFGSTIRSEIAPQSQNAIYLASVVDSVVDQLQRWNIWAQSEVWIIGLADSEGGFASFAKLNGKKPEDWNNKEELDRYPDTLGQAQLGALVKGVPLEQALSRQLYSETLQLLPNIVQARSSRLSPALNDQPTLPQQLERLAVTFAKRTLVCRWEEKLLPETTLSGSVAVSYYPSFAQASTPATEPAAARELSDDNEENEADLEIIEELKRNAHNMRQNRFTVRQLPSGYAIKNTDAIEKADCVEWASKQFQRILKNDLGLSKHTGETMMSQIQTEAK